MCHSCRVPVLLISLSGFFLISSCSEKRDPEAPNVILILADDLGWKDTGFMGSDFYETPNLDILASEGMVFTQAYAGASNCAPSRACLMSGLNTPRHGIFTVGPSERGDPRTRKLIPEPNADSLDDSFTIIPEKLAEEGYISASIGKWHLGKDPCSQGFTVNVGGSYWGMPGSYFAPYGAPDIPAPEGEYLTDRLTAEAIRFVEEYRDQKFFLYLPYYAVHSPWEGKDHLVKRFEQKKTGQCQGNPVYAAMIANLDSCIGVLINRLHEMGLDRNTLVIFTSDNGAVSHISCQDPLRAGKGSYYEGGIRVPMVIRWPGRIPAGSTTDVPVVNLDLYPTILEAVGIDYPEESMDGVSIWPLLKNNSGPSARTLAWHYPVYLETWKQGRKGFRDPLFRTRPGTTILYGDWKLNYYYEDSVKELFNLRNDQGEHHDLSGDLPARTSELYGMMQEWIRSQHAPVPQEPNPSYDPVYQRDRINELLKEK